MRRPRPFSLRLAPWLRQPTARDAFTLIELLLYLTILAILMGIGYAVFFESITNSLNFRRSADDIVKVLRAGEKWRSDVRASGEVRLETNPGEQLLRLRRGAGEIRYRFTASGVARSVANQPWTPILANVATARFVPDLRERVSAWRWELELQTRSNRPGIVRPRFMFIAVPAGQPPP